MKKLLTLSALLLCVTMQAMDGDAAEGAAESQEEYVFDHSLRVMAIDHDSVVAFRRELQAGEVTRGSYQKGVALLGAAALAYGAWRWHTSAAEKSALGERIYALAENSVALEEARNKLDKEQFEKVKKKMEEEEAAKAGQPDQQAGAAPAVVPAPAEAQPPVPATPEQLRKDAITVKVEADGTVNKAELEKFVRSLVNPTTTLIPQEQTWGEWFTGGVKSGWAWVVIVPTILIKSRIAHEMARYIFGYFPYPGQAADFLFQPRTLNWCLDNRTQFYTSAVGLKNLSVQLKTIFDRKAVLKEKDVSQIKAYVWHANELFVREMERVLGYMQFIIAQIDPEDEVVRNRRMREIGVASLGLLQERVDELVDDANAFLQADVKAAECGMLARNLDDKLFGVICHLESFEPVVYAAGIEDINQRDRFAFWKEFIKPGALASSPKRQEDEVKAKEGQTIKELMETAVDWREVVGL